MTRYKGNQQTSAKKAAATARRIGKSKIKENLEEIQLEQTFALMEQARNVGLSAARAVHARPGGEDYNWFLRIKNMRIERSAQVGPVWVKVAEDAYEDEYNRLKNEPHSSVDGESCCELAK